MTDLNRWDRLIHVVKQRHQQPDGQWTGRPGVPVFAEYVMVPLSEYQIGNLLGALKQAEETGDWYQEIISVLATAMEEAGLGTVESNAGGRWTRDDLLKGEL